MREYTVPVTKNFLELHFFWAGKGTCCVPTQGYYGASVSAISVSPHGIQLYGLYYECFKTLGCQVLIVQYIYFPDFTPTVPNKLPTLGSTKKHTGLIVGIVAAFAVLGLLAIFGILIWRQKKRRLSMEDEGINYFW